MNTALLLMIEGTMIQGLQNRGQMSLAASIALSGYDGKGSLTLCS
jgi:hypothetical protein